MRLNHRHIRLERSVLEQVGNWLSTSSDGGERPVVTISLSSMNQQAGSATITGSVSNTESLQATVIHNSRSLPLTLDPDSSYNYILALSPGVNTVSVRATNSSGTATSEQLRVEYAPSGEDGLYFRVTLLWDGTGDVDLHTWDPLGGHSWYGNQTSPAGELDIDNTWANGPENFTCRTLSDGRYRIGVNAYSRCANRSAYIRVNVISGPNAGTYYFGPYKLTETNSNGGYPVTGNTASWWRPCDIVVFGSTVRVVDPDTNPVNRGVATRSITKEK